MKTFAGGVLVGVLLSAVILFAARHTMIQRLDDRAVMSHPAYIRVLGTTARQNMERCVGMFPRPKGFDHPDQAPPPLPPGWGRGANPR
jgi:hypothetical protein